MDIYENKYFKIFLECQTYSFIHVRLKRWCKYSKKSFKYKKIVFFYTSHVLKSFILVVTPLCVNCQTTQENTNICHLSSILFFHKLYM